MKVVMPPVTQEKQCILLYTIITKKDLVFHFAFDTLSSYP